MKLSPRKNEKGTGIIEVLVVLGIVLIIFTFLIDSFLNLNKLQKKKQTQIGHLIVKLYVNEYTDCNKTQQKNGNSCSKGSSLELIGSDGSTVINKSSSQYTNIGPNYQVRAICDEGGRIDIQSRRVKNGKPIKDPLTGKIPGKDSNGWISQFNKIPFSCDLNN